jgi:hypothetical protein
VFCDSSADTGLVSEERNHWAQLAVCTSSLDTTEVVACRKARRPRTQVGIDGAAGSMTLTREMQKEVYIGEVEESLRCGRSNAGGVVIGDQTYLSAALGMV